jgi:hypothetical protein
MNSVDFSLRRYILLSVVHDRATFYCSLRVARSVIDGNANIVHIHSPAICIVKSRSVIFAGNTRSKEDRGGSKGFRHLVPGFALGTNTIRTVAYLYLLAY